ncbi:MAG: clostripain-related cysteine peptidase [Clostridia bacterium]
MFCIKCGEKILDNAKFCQNCGAKAISGVADNQEEKIEQVHTNSPMQGQPIQSQPIQSQPMQSQPMQGQPIQGQPMQNQPQVNRSMPKKKRKGCLIPAIIIIAIFTAIVVIGGIFIVAFWEIIEEESKVGLDSGYSSAYSESVSEPIISNLSSLVVRDDYTTIMGDGTDEVTIMVYLLGSDLETDGGYASTDLQEMINADFGDNLNLVVMTGGARKWENSSISGSTCQYWQVKDGKLISINDNLGKLDMTSEDTLSDFITDATELFPANRYALILWDHGGGTMSGYGYDENFPDGQMSIDEISRGLSETGVKFDFVGFDACLMATLETAVMLEPYADYMIASEETEEATGWYYTEFLETWSDDTGMETLDVSIVLADSFVEASVADYRRAESTLSVVELKEIPAVYQVFVDYFDDVDISTDQSAYTTLSSALSKAKSFGAGDYEQIDIVELVYLLDFEGTEDLIGAINSAVKYNVSSDSVDGANGLSMYFPYVYPEYYSETVASMETIGYGDEYIDFLNQYVSASAGEYYEYSTGDWSGFGGGGGQGGQGQGQGGGSQGGQGEGQQPGGGGSLDFSQESWYDANIADAYASWYDGTMYEELEIVFRGGEYVLQLSDEQWEEISLIEIQALLDDGEGYIDLGSDNVYEFDKNGDLLIMFDYTWVTLDGHTVPFYAIEEVTYSDNDWYTYGSVPAILNDTEYVEVIVYWDDDNPYGYVTGYRRYSTAGEPLGKGTFSFTSGDTLEWVFDYYDYDGNYVGTCSFGDEYVYNGREIEVSYDYVGDYDAMVHFQLTDIYNHVYTSESVYYTD